MVCLITWLIGKATESGNGPLEKDESSLVVCFGEMLIDFVPTTSGLSLSEAPAFKKAPGGAPANVAVGIARLGGDAAFIGKVFNRLPRTYNVLLDLITLHLLCSLSLKFSNAGRNEEIIVGNLICVQVGEDEFGYMLANILKENNVNNEGMRFDPGARTALAFVTLRKDGEREFMFYRNPSADMLLQKDELDLEMIRKVETSRA